jgi:hypothetical protein
MLAVEKGPYVASSYGLVFGAPVKLDRFLIDRTEVTNEQFKEFVEAGGYERAEFWTEPFVKDGRTLPWEESMAFFRDSTGRPGPATWVLGDYAQGDAQHPVGGVSWYEAAAYARFRGKSLPTLHHWIRAALPGHEVSHPLSPSIVTLANIEQGEEPVPVASRSAIGLAGPHDMAGNVREWVWNAAGEHRYLLGGAWSDPSYLFSLPTLVSPWSRFPTHGFRCVKYLGGEPAALKAPLDPPPSIDYRRLPSVSDEAFETARRFAAYDPAPLKAVVEASTPLPWGGREERITLDAAYGDERLIVRIQLPDAGDPPYQAVVWFPAAHAFSVRESAGRWYEAQMSWLEFFPRSGRVLVLPVYAGSYERNDGRTWERLAQPSSALELVVQWRRDLGRTLDYLEERPDIDAGKVAYAGASMGAWLGPLFLAHDDRFRAAMLWVGGFEPRADAVLSVDVARRTTTPVLMLNGRYDSLYPLETNQKALFDLLGTPERDKRHAVFETTHWPLPKTELIKENLAWLDRYLGPVE